MAEKKEGYTLYTGEYKGPKGEKAIHLAEKQGKEVETYKKGTRWVDSVEHTNKGNLDGRHVAKLLSEEESVKGNPCSYSVPVMSHDLRIAIGQARNEKKLSQEQLAQAISEPKANISAYESGKSVPSGKSIASIERALGVKLPRPEKKKISNE